jgi:hypothetical protein
MLVQIVIEYEYEGDETTAQAAANAEALAWLESQVGVADIVGAHEPSDGRTAGAVVRVTVGGALATVDLWQEVAAQQVRAASSR